MNVINNKKKQLKDNEFLEIWKLKNKTKANSYIKSFINDKLFYINTNFLELEKYYLKKLEKIVEDRPKTEIDLVSLEFNITPYCVHFSSKWKYIDINDQNINHLQILYALEKKKILKILSIELIPVVFERYSPLINNLDKVIINNKNMSSKLIVELKIDKNKISSFSIPDNQINNLKFLIDHRESNLYKNNKINNQKPSIDYIDGAVYIDSERVLAISGPSQKDILTVLKNNNWDICFDEIIKNKSIGAYRLAARRLSLRLKDELDIEVFIHDSHCIHIDREKFSTQNEQKMNKS